MTKLKFEGEKIEMYMWKPKTNTMKTIDISWNDKNNNDHSLKFQYMPASLLNTSHKWSHLIYSYYLIDRTESETSDNASKITQLVIELRVVSSSVSFQSMGLLLLFIIIQSTAFIVKRVLFIILWRSNK